jgi:hypothetical protein
MRRKLPILAALCVSMLAAADQPFDIRPGLWKFTVTLDAGNGSQTLTRSNCVTADDIRSVRILEIDASPGRACTNEVTRQTADAIEGVIQCTTASGSSRTQVSFLASSPTRITGTMRAAGAAAAMTISVAGEWVGAACPATDDADTDAAE